VQSLTSSVATSNWRFGRAISGDQYSQNLDRSRFELPHRVIAYGTFSLSTRTDISLIYLGQSGSNYDFVYGGSGGAGDLNADGAQGNDLIYIPSDVAKESEIRFSGVSPSPARTIRRQHSSSESPNSGLPSSATSRASTA